MKHFLTTLALTAALAVPAAAQEAKTVGVSIPAATHGWAGGMNFFAQEAVKRMEKSIRTSTSFSPPHPTRPSR